MSVHPRGSPEPAPDVWVITIEHDPHTIRFGAIPSSYQLFTRNDGTIFEYHGCAGAAFIFGTGVAGKGASPGDVAMADRVQRIAGFAKTQRVPECSFRKAK